jgi:hypothetical protein
LLLAAPAATSRASIACRATDHDNIRRRDARAATRPRSRKWRLVLGLLCLHLGATAHAGNLASQRVETYRIILKDGTTLNAANYPLAGFGEVRATLTDGRFVVLDDRKIDMERSRAAWDAATGWAMLDRAKLQGKAFPAFVANDSKGVAVTFAPTSKGLTFVAVWSGY